MVPWRATDDGFVTPRRDRLVRRFAEGKPGVIVVEATGIRDVPSGPLLRIGHDRFVDGPARRSSSAVREASRAARRCVFIQLIDFLSIRRRPPRDKFFARFLALTAAHREALARARPATRRATCSDDEAARQARGAARRATLHDVLSPRELEDLERGYRERVTDTHLPHIAELPRVLPGLFADAAAPRARRRASTASSCTTRTRTRWRRSCRR